MSAFQLPFSVAVWSRRQKRQHQYTPAVPTEVIYAYSVRDESPNQATRLAHGPIVGYGPAGAASESTLSPAPRAEVILNASQPLQGRDRVIGSSDCESASAAPGDPYRSYRALKSDIRRHAPRVAAYNDKITSLPEPRVVEAALSLQRDRRPVSHRQFSKEKMGHTRTLNRMEYSLDF